MITVFLTVVALIISISYAAGMVASQVAETSHQISKLSEQYQHSTERADGQAQAITAIGTKVDMMSQKLDEVVRQQQADHAPIPMRSR